MKFGEAIREALLCFFFPPRCPKCGAYRENRGDWCSECLEDTLRSERVSLSPTMQQNLDGVWALGHYREGLQNLIRGLKFHGKQGNLFWIRSFLSAAEERLRLSQLSAGSCIAVPVPLYPEKEKERGFNQVELIFVDWLHARGMPLRRILSRTRQTPPMYGLDAEARSANLSDAFALAPGVDLRGKTVWLLDDIMTTGTTLMECAKVLRRGGARRVYGLVLASDHR